MPIFAAQFVDNFFGSLRLEKNIEIIGIVKQRIYIDTSVWGGVFDKVFLFETVLLFDLIKTMQMTCLYSEITETELIYGSENNL